MVSWRRDFTIQGNCFLYNSKTGQQLFQRSRLTGFDLFSASQSTKHWPRFPVNIEKSLTERNGCSDISPTARHVMAVFKDKGHLSPGRRLCITFNNIPNISNSYVYWKVCLKFHLLFSLFIKQRLSVQFNPIWHGFSLNRQSYGGGGRGAWEPPSLLCCYCSDDHEIWHRYQAWCILRNGRKKFVVSLQLRHYDVIICILDDA